MWRLAPLALLWALACTPPPEEPPLGTPKGTIGGSGGSVKDAGTQTDGGTDGGTDAGTNLIPCSPKVQPTTCAQGTYCACSEPAGQGSACYCYSGQDGEPCPTGAAVCKFPTMCRWSDGQFWGVCGTGAYGDPCDEQFTCDIGLSCPPQGTSNCKWSRCCE